MIFIKFQNHKNQNIRKRTAQVAEERTKRKEKILQDRRFSCADEVTGKLNSDFNDWCALLTSHSLQTTFAIIGANWAVHGSAENILNNYFSKISLIIVFVF